jgi:hypothetical protein
MTKRIGIVAIFLVGCAVGAGSGAFVVPKASAQQAAQLSRWEYVCVSGKSEDVQIRSNQLGDERWEMVGIGADQWLLTGCFKRPKP